MKYRARMARSYINALMKESNVHKMIIIMQEGDEKQESAGLLESAVEESSVGREESGLFDWNDGESTGTVVPVVPLTDFDDESVYVPYDPVDFYGPIYEPMR